MVIDEICSGTRRYSNWVVTEERAPYKFKDANSSRKVNKNSHSSLQLMFLSYFNFKKNKVISINLMSFSLSLAFAPVSHI